MNKPRIKKIFGLWFCRVSVCGVTFFYQPRPAIGIGYTPEQAYQEWKKAEAR
jgi:hypothetical protein